MFFTLSYTVFGRGSAGSCCLAGDDHGWFRDCPTRFQCLSTWSPPPKCGAALGANGNWDSNANWATGAAPGYVGDSLLFAGTTDLSPVIDQNYTLAGLSFSNNAGAFSTSTAAAAAF
jgi:hypothetical protein